MDVTPITKQEFMVSALAIAKEQGFVWSSITDAHDEHLARIYKKWGGDSELAKFETVETALINFRETLIKGKNSRDEKMREEVRDIKIDTISCKISIPVGGGRIVDFGAAAKIPEDSTPDEKRYFYGKLFQACFQGLMEMKQNPPPQLNPQTQYTHTGDAATAQFSFHTIEMEVSKGKYLFSVKGDDFPLHGIPVYNEVLAKAGIRVQDLKEGANSFLGVATYVKNEKQQAHKVVHLQVNG